MSRKNFLSTDFFVTASEKEARNILLSLPGQLSQLTLLKEDTIIHSTRFLFENLEKGTKYYVDVTMLPLNDQYVRFSLHCSFTNGQPIQSGNEIKNVLQQFERSIFAAANNDFATLYQEPKRRERQKKSLSLINYLLSIIISKYHY